MAMPVRRLGLPFIRAKMARLKLEGLCSVEEYFQKAHEDTSWSADYNLKVMDLEHL